MDFQIFNSPHSTDGGREKHLWMFGVWSISSVSRLWRLYRLFHQRAPAPNWIHGNSLSSSPPSFDSPPRLALLFTCFGDLAGGSKSSTLGKSARVWSVRSVSGCARVIQLRSDVVESSLDELIETLDELIETSDELIETSDELIETLDEEDFFSNLVDRLTLLGHSEARIHGVGWSPQS